MRSLSDWEWVYWGPEDVQRGLWTLVDWGLVGRRMAKLVSKSSSCRAAKYKICEKHLLLRAIKSY